MGLNAFFSKPRRWNISSPDFMFKVWPDFLLNIYNSLKHSQLSVTRKLGARGNKMCSKRYKVTHISETKRTTVLIFVPIPPFSTPQSPFMIVSNIPNYRLTQN